MTSTPELRNRMAKAWRIGRVLASPSISDAVLLDPRLRDVDQDTRRLFSGSHRTISDHTWRLAIAIARRIRRI